MIARIALGVVGLVLSLGSLLLVLLTVVPVPSYRIWRFSLGAIELSLWLGTAGMAGAVLTLATFRLSGLGWTALVAGLVALGLGLVPPLQARQVAARERVPVSGWQYFAGPHSAPAAVRVDRDLVYAEVDGQTLRLDVYRPPRPATAAPAVVVVHGGSWSGGAKGEFFHLSRVLAAEGYVVFDVDYRLAAPGRHFPTQVGDVKCAIGWIKGHAAAYGVDPARLAVLGRSAGGQLALVAAYAPNDPALPPSCPAGDTTVRVVISFYAPVDLIWGYNNPANPDLIGGPAALRRYLGGSPTERAAAYRLASPQALVAPGAPPTLAVHGGRDRLVGVRHVDFLRQALERAGVPHHVVVLPWADHGFDFFPNGWGSQITRPLILRFLRQHLQ